MTERTPFQHAVANPSVRKDIAAAVRDGIPVEQLAEEFNISESTVRSYAAEWQGAHRKVQLLTDWEREAIIEGCARGARRRWERELGLEVICELLGES
ncbi:helix-turn-helix domain-containing protein [Mycolicibacterium fortuitum]